MTKKNYYYHLNIGRNNMLRDPNYVPRNTSQPVQRKSFKHPGAPFSRNNTEFDEEANTYPITTPINNIIDKFSRNEALHETIRKILKVIQSQYLPQINKLEILLLKNPTYLYITKLLGISKENAVRITGVIAVIAIVCTANSICRSHKRTVLDTFIYATPAISIYQILKKEPELMDEKKSKARRFIDTKQLVREEYNKTHQLKTWMIYLIISSLFNITDNFFINRTKPAIEPTFTQTVITTTPYLLRDTNKQVFTTIAQVTPFSERVISAVSQSVKSTVQYAWYWVLKFGVTYWMGYKDGREVLYNKLVIPLIRKYYEYELKNNNGISEMDLTTYEEEEEDVEDEEEDIDSYTPKNNYYGLPEQQLKASSNTRDQGLQLPGSNAFEYGNFDFYRAREGSRKEDLLDLNNSRNVDGYFSDSYYESSEPINIRLNNSGIFSSVKYSNTTNNRFLIQNSDSLSVEDPWKSNSFIQNINNTPIKRNRSFSLNSINHANNSFNNYKATIFDVNNKLSDYYNDISFERDTTMNRSSNGNGNNNNNGNTTFYYNSLKARNPDSAI